MGRESSSISGYKSSYRCFMIHRTETSLYLQDTAGMERYRAVASSYYRGAQGAILGTFSLPARMRVLAQMPRSYSSVRRFQQGNIRGPPPVEQ